MDFENELIPGVLIKRYKRFFVDIKLSNKTITAHCPNPGSMFNLLKTGKTSLVFQFHFLFPGSRDEEGSLLQTQKYNPVE